jgi:hypothetical protein
MRYQKVTRVLVAVAAVMLVGTAVLHTVAGYPRLSHALAATNLKPSIVTVLRSFWISSSVHWVIAAAIATVAAFSANGRNRAMTLMLVALLPGIDAVLTLLSLGLFPGNGLLLSASGLLIAAATLSWLAKAH